MGLTIKFRMLVEHIVVAVTTLVVKGLDLLFRLSILQTGFWRRIETH